MVTGITMPMKMTDYNEYGSHWPDCTGKEALSSTKQTVLFKN